jgi:hypothetical protein
LKEAMAGLSPSARQATAINETPSLCFKAPITVGRPVPLRRLIPLFVTGIFFLVIRFTFLRITAVCDQQGIRKNWNRVSLSTFEATLQEEFAQVQCRAGVEGV